ncbi:MAG: hypothetical protein LLG45_13170 [Actinomycetia bacterium]|nr:hypothetical protein [Actinomycetes bacterium]
MTETQILPRHVCQEVRGQVSFLEGQFKAYEEQAREILREGWVDAQDMGGKFPACFLNKREWAFIARVAGFKDILEAAAWLKGVRSS